MYNKVILVGNLTKNIELRYSQTGKAIANTSIATNKKWKDQSGQQKEEVMFIDITFFGRTAEIANQYLNKGSKILVDGRIKFDQWTDRDGKKHSKHSIVVEAMKMLGGKNDNQSNNAQTNSYQQYGNTTTQSNNAQTNQQQNGLPSFTDAAGNPITREQFNALQQQAQPRQIPQPDAIPEIDLDDEMSEIPFN